MSQAATGPDALRIEVASVEVEHLVAVETLDGVAITFASGRNGPGTGYLRADATSRIAWKEPGSATWGAWVDVSAGGAFVLPGGDDPDAYVRVAVDLTYLPTDVAEHRVLMEDVYNNGVASDDVTAAEAAAGDVETVTLDVVNDGLFHIDRVKAWLTDTDIISWEEVAPKLGAETYILSMAVLDGTLYGGTAPNGKLYKWNGTDAWVEVAPTLGAETRILSMAVLDGTLYGGTATNGKLYKWNGTDAWVEVAPTLGAETYIPSMAVLDGTLYGGTYPNGKLYEWNGTDAWVEVAPQLGAETYIFSMAVLDGTLYGGTYPNGKLYEWNGTDAWVEVAPTLGAETRIYSMAVLDGTLYGGTATNGKLYKWNGTDAWVEVAPTLGAETYIFSMAVLDGTLYGGTYPNGKLYEWNGTDAWVEVAPQLGAETYIFSMAVLDGKLYGGTYPNGKLYRAVGSLEISPDNIAWSAPGAETDAIDIADIAPGASQSLYVRRTILAGAALDPDVLNHLHYSFTGGV